MGREDLYPDVIVAGGLADAISLRSKALGAAWLANPARLLGGKGAEVIISTDRGEVRVNVSTVRRSFVIEIWRRGAVWLSGSTSEMDSLVGLADAWHRGASLTSIRERWPFVELDRLAEARERGDVIEVQWDLLVRESELAEMRELIGVARNKPELRQLFPWVSHHGVRLRFSRCTGYPFTIDIPYIEADLYSFNVVDEVYGRLLGVFVTPFEAVDAVVAVLPEDIGPAIDGTRDDM